MAQPAAHAHTVVSFSANCVVGVPQLLSAGLLQSGTNLAVTRHLPSDQKLGSQSSSAERPLAQASVLPGGSLVDQTDGQAFSTVTSFVARYLPRSNALENVVVLSTGARLSDVFAEYSHRLRQADSSIKCVFETLENMRAEDPRPALPTPPSSVTSAQTTPSVATLTSVISPSGSDNIATASDANGCVSKFDQAYSSLVQFVAGSPSPVDTAIATTAASSAITASNESTAPKEKFVLVSPDRRREARDKTVTLRDLFLAGLLKAGMVIEYRYKAHESSKTAIVTDQGTLRTDDGRSFPSLYAWVHKSYGSTGTRIGYFKIANSKTTFLDLREEYLRRTSGPDDATHGSEPESIVDKTPSTTPAAPASPLGPSKDGTNTVAAKRRAGSASVSNPKRKRRSSARNFNEMDDDENYGESPPRDAEARHHEPRALSRSRAGEAAPVKTEDDPGRADPSHQELLAADVLGQILSSRGSSLFGLPASTDSSVSPAPASLVTGLKGGTAAIHPLTN